MAKRQFLVSNAIGGTTIKTTNYTTFLSKIAENENGKKVHQQIALRELFLANKN